VCSPERQKHGALCGDCINLNLAARGRERATEKAQSEMIAREKEAAREADERLKD